MHIYLHVSYKNKIKIPTILNGGIGKEQDILEVLKNYKVDTNKKKLFTNEMKKLAS